MKIEFENGSTLKSIGNEEDNIRSNVRKLDECGLNDLRGFQDYMNKKKCSDCVAHELIGYVRPLHIVRYCHQGEMIIEDIEMAEECQCFEKIGKED